MNESHHNVPIPNGQSHPEHSELPCSGASSSYNEIPNQFQYLFQGSQNFQYTSSLPPYRKLKHPKNIRGKMKAIGLLTICAILSAGAGFGGGWLAIQQLNENSTILYQAVPDQREGNITGLSISPHSSTAQVVNTVSPSVVEITTESLTTSVFLQQYVTDGAGSGVIISGDGYVVTNHHVVTGANKIIVTTQDGKDYDATIVGTDTKSDLAVLKIEVQGLTPAIFGDSDAIQVGEEAIVIGNPLGKLGGTVTNGIISAKSRDVTIEGETMNLLQTNAAVNPGNSGGGLFDNQGRLVGIINAKSSGSGVEGLGFAIPINTAREVIEDLIERGYVSGRPSIGLQLIDVSDFSTAIRYRVNRLGVYIQAVTPGSGAEKAGLLSGDYILSADGEEVASSADLKSVLNSHKVGDTMNLTVLRGGSVLTIAVVLGEYVP